MATYLLRLGSRPLRRRLALAAYHRILPVKRVPEAAASGAPLADAPMAERELAGASE